MFRVLCVSVCAGLAFSLAVAAEQTAAPPAGAAVTAESEDAEFFKAFGEFARAEQLFRRFLVMTLSRTVSVHDFARRHGKAATEDAINAEINVAAEKHLEQWTRNMLNAYVEVLGEDATRSLAAEGRNSPHFGAYESWLNEIGAASKERNEPVLKQAAKEILTRTQQRLNEQ